MAYGAAWLSLALVLTGVSGALTYLAWRSRGASALLKGIGITCLPMALWATGLLRLVTTIVDQVGAFATGLVFSPRVWIGVVLAVVGVAFFLAGTRLGGTRFAGSGARPRGAESRPARKRPKAVEQSSPVDDELADIEKILRERGIS